MQIGRIGRALLVFGAVAAVTACDPSMMPGSRTKAQFNVAGTRVTIAAPQGWCIDPDSARRSADGAFVLLTDCALLGRSGAAAGRRGVALAASVSDGTIVRLESDAEGLSELRAFAATRDGRSVLGRSGQPDRVRILATETTGGIYYVLVEDRGALPVAGLDREFWRAFLDVKGRTVALSTLGFTGESDAQASLNELVAFARSIQAANGS